MSIAPSHSLLQFTIVKSANAVRPNGWVISTVDSWVQLLPSVVLTLYVAGHKFVIVESVIPLGASYQLKE